MPGKVKQPSSRKRVVRVRRRTRTAILFQQLMAGMALLVAAGCATQSKHPVTTVLPARVIRLKGAARCSSDNGLTWRELGVGQLLGPGALIQTAAKSSLDIAFDGPPTTPRTAADKGALYHPKPAADFMMRIWQNSMLNVDYLALRQTDSPLPLVQARFELRLGRVFALVPELAEGSDFEVRFGFGIVGGWRTAFDVSSEGTVRVLAGNVSVAWAGKPNPRVIHEHQMFDARTGARTPLPSPAS